MKKDPNPVNSVEEQRGLLHAPEVVSYSVLSVSAIAAAPGAALL